MQRFRRRYIQVDTTLDFLGDAVNSRTSPQLRAALSTLDRLAVASMTPVLRAGQQAGSARAGLSGQGHRRLDPASRRPALGARSGHAGRRDQDRAPQSLSSDLAVPRNRAPGRPPHRLDCRPCAPRSRAALADDAELSAMWTPWASEIAADVFAFLHTGYASVAALYDVVGDARDDPALAGRRSASDRLAAHRCSAARLHGSASARPVHGTRCSVRCRRSFPVTAADATLQPLLVRSMAAMPRIAAACLSAPVPALRRPADDRRARSRARLARCARRTRARRRRRALDLAALAVRARASASSRSPACARPSGRKPRPSGSNRARGWLTTQARAA